MIQLSGVVLMYRSVKPNKIQRITDPELVQVGPYPRLFDEEGRGVY